MELEICREAKSLDFLINVPVMKGHCQTKITCALKNMKGLLPNREKRHFHAMGLHKPIAHLAVGLLRILFWLTISAGTGTLRTEAIRWR